jgi:prevent-host-death family protein
MEAISVHEAQSELSRLLEAVEAGEEVVITRNGLPVARLIRAAANPTRRFGTLPGAVTIRDDFDEPLSIEDLDNFTR